MLFYVFDFFLFFLGGAGAINTTEQQRKTTWSVKTLRTAATENEKIS